MGETKSAAVVAPAMEYSTYLADRNAKLALSEQQQQFLDKSLLTLSGGALGLTLTLLHDQGSTIGQAWYAEAGIALLVTSLLCVLLSVSFSQRSISLHINALDLWCQHGFLPNERHSKPVQSNPWAGVTLWLNRGAIAGFLLGAALISVFVISNVQPDNGGTRTMTDKTATPTSSPIERGAVIKPPPVQNTQPAQPAAQSEKK